MAQLANAMRFIRTHEGGIPDTLHSIQHKNSVLPSGVSEQIIKKLHDKFEDEELLRRGDIEIVLCLVDGFLLYSDQDVIEKLDLRLLVRAPYAKLRERRDNREGYVTLDGISSAIGDE
jgi:nicotinamide/nicotinate riboside kinase